MVCCFLSNLIICFTCIKIAYCIILSQFFQRLPVWTSFVAKFPLTLNCYFVATAMLHDPPLLGGPLIISPPYARPLSPLKVVGLALLYSSSQCTQ